MKRILFSLGIFVFALTGFTTTLMVNPNLASAANYFFDFNNGNMNGLTSSPNHYGHLGNWRVENGILVQDQPGDGYIALVDNFSGTDQTLETKLLATDPAGYGGFSIWQQDADNLVAIVIYPGYGKVFVQEISNNVSNIYGYTYSFVQNTWYSLKVEADSTNGSFNVYANDVYLFTQTVNTSLRSGFSGLFSGNNGGYFDDFRLTTPEIVPTVPTTKDDCKKDGWKKYTDLSFKNQGSCVSYIESNEKAAK